MFMPLQTRQLTSINYLHRIIKSYYMKILRNPDPIEYMAKAPVYITLKDHKGNYRSAHPCRLISPCKSEIGKISKLI